MKVLLRQGFPKSNTGSQIQKAAFSFFYFFPFGTTAHLQKRESSEAAVTPSLFSTEYFCLSLQGNKHCSECESVEHKKVIYQIFHCRNREVFCMLLLYSNVEEACTV